MNIEFTNSTSSGELVFCLSLSGVQYRTLKSTSGQQVLQFLIVMADIHLILNARG
jgi:hypothetical protein